MAKMRIMKKNYHVVNRTTGATIVVHPARLPGLNRDKKDAKTSTGKWVRLYDVVDANGVDTSDLELVRPDNLNTNSIVLYNESGERPSVVVNGQRWELEAIPGVVAPKPRSAKKEVIVDASPVVVDGEAGDSEADTSSDVESGVAALVE